MLWTYGGGGIMKSYDNKTTTVESMVAFIGLLYAETKDQFNYYYRIAAHGENEKSTWFYLEDYAKSNHNYYERRKERLKNGL